MQANCKYIKRGHDINDMAGLACVAHHLLSRVSLFHVNTTFLFRNLTQEWRLLLQPLDQRYKNQNQTIVWFLYSGCQ